MKSYTDIEQSKKLAEILPIESADMVWVCGRLHTDGPKYQVLKVKEEVSEPENYIPAWSLVALLNILPVSLDEGRHCLALINSNPNGDIEWLCCYEDDNGSLLMGCYGDNQVDACVEMIYELKKTNLL